MFVGHMDNVICFGSVGKSSVEKPCTRLLPLTLCTPHVSILHTVHFAALPDVTTGLLMTSHGLR